MPIQNKLCIWICISLPVCRHLVPSCQQKYLPKCFALYCTVQQFMLTAMPLSRGRARKVGDCTHVPTDSKPLFPDWFKRLLNKKSASSAASNNNQSCTPGTDMYGYDWLSSGSRLEIWLANSVRHIVLRNMIGFRKFWKIRNRYWDNQ